MQNKRKHGQYAKALPVHGGQAGMQEYVYLLKAHWQQDGQTVSREREVTIHAGERITIDFSRPSQGGAPPRPQPAN